MFTEGSCLKGYGSNRPCQRKHGANPEAIGCWYNEAFGDTCKATGTCPYNHAFPRKPLEQSPVERLDTA